MWIAVRNIPSKIRDNVSNITTLILAFIYFPKRLKTTLGSCYNFP